MKVFSSALLFLALTQVGGQRLGAPRKERYVLSYNNEVTVNDVEAIVAATGADVERRLTGARGLVISVDADKEQELLAKPGFSLRHLSSHSSQGTRRLDLHCNVFQHPACP